MKKNLIKKSLIVDNISNLILNPNIVSLVCYSGIKSLRLKILRSFLFKIGVGVRVAKNSIAKKVLKNIGYDVLTDYVSGQVLMVFSNNVFSVLLALRDLKKEDIFVIKQTAINNFLVSSDDVKILLDFRCERNILLKITFVLNSPLFNFLNVLNLPVLTFLKLVELIKLRKGEQNVS